MSSVMSVTDATFAAEVLGSSQPVLVDYWADWCAPCRQLSPVIDELAVLFDGRVKFVKVDTNENPVTTASQDIRALPTIHIFDQGHIVASMVGSVTKMKLRQSLESL